MSDSNELLMYRNALYTIAGLTTSFFFDVEEDDYQPEYPDLVERIASINNLVVHVLEKNTAWEQLRKKVYERQPSPSS